jgi:Na+:H+ antiporter, NhaA family
MSGFFKTYLINPIKHFMHDSKSVGIMLLACTGLSLLIANWDWAAQTYLHFWHYSFSGLDQHHVEIGFLSLPNSPLLLINDGLMAIFFFLAGMEIKREMMDGQLSSLKQSLLPVFGAIGGMLAPAIVYGLFNKGQENIHGWAIPTATDIAFTLGVASLLGKRVPMGLKIFLTALAIIDDLGAILVIALFYGSHLQIGYLLGVLICVGIIYWLNKKQVAFGIWQFLIGILLWYCMFNSGIHATVAGVIFAFLVPVKHLRNFESGIHLPVYFLIIPLFALANTAIPVPANSFQALDSRLGWGIILGLCLGKPLGITAACYFLVQRKWAELPEGITWYKIIGAGILAGIGFTMSIFISTLAFKEVAVQDIAKIAVLLASMIAIIGGYCWFRFEPKKKPFLKIFEEPSVTNQSN